jgi:hypothetical protein
MNALPSHLSPEPTDSEDVASALETADVFWTKGDADEAMRWLKRAAESASDAGNDDRALAIARTVADLKSAPARAVEVPIATHKLNPPPPPSATRQAPSPPSAGRTLTSESSEVRRAPAHLPSAPVGDGVVPVKGPASQKAPPPTPKPRESVSPPAAPLRQSSMPPAPPPKRPSATERAVEIQEPTRALAAPPAKPQAAPAAAPQPARTQPVAVSSVATAEAPVPAVRRPPSATSAPKEPNRPPASATAATAYRALTVFVRPEGRDGDKLEVILAMPGQAVPAGAEPAMLVPTRRGARLLD